MTTRINLLPWRAELRRARTRRFYVMLGGAVAVGVGIFFAGQTYYQGRIDFQERRNAILEQEIAQLEKRIVKIRDLEKTKERLIARMNVIQTLQQDRPQIVHLFEQFVSTLPSGLYLTGIEEDSANLTIQGVAESNARVSSYMENLDQSAWLDDPDLTVIEVRDREGVRISDFTLSVKQSGAATDEGDDKDGGS